MTTKTKTTMPILALFQELEEKPLSFFEAERIESYKLKKGKDSYREYTDKRLVELKLLRKRGDYVSLTEMAKTFAFEANGLNQLPRHDRETKYVCNQRESKDIKFWILYLIIASLERHPILMKSYQMDFFLHDRNILETIGIEEKFIWIVRECGTKLWRESEFALLDVELKNNPDSIAYLWDNGNMSRIG